MEAIDLKWHEFKRAVDMQQSYLELAIKLNLFTYTIIGAIVSFYFTHTEVAMAKYALGLPILLSAALGALFLMGAMFANRLRLNIKASAAELGLRTAPEGILLVMICVIFGAMLVLVFVTLLWFFAHAG